MWHDYNKWEEENEDDNSVEFAKLFAPEKDQKSKTSSLLKANVTEPCKKAEPEQLSFLALVDAISPKKANEVEAQ